MSLKSIEQQDCASCHKTGGILVCNGCQQAFCGKHVVEHRQHLGIQLENIMQEHDCIRQDISMESNTRIPYEKIDKWEKESIAKIQAAAEKARTDLRENIERSNEHLLTECQDIAIKLRAARENENFSEIELNQWMKELNALKIKIKSKSTIYIQEDQYVIVPCIRIEQVNTSIGNALVWHKDSSSPKTLSLSSKASITSSMADRFAEVSGLATIDDGGLSIQHADRDLEFVYSYCQQLYSNGRHVVKLKIERTTGPCNLFFGICASNINLRKIIFHFVVVAGWLSNGEVWLHGKINNVMGMNGNKIDEIKVNDILRLTLDCDRKQIELFQERTNIERIVQIDTMKTPFPWRILVALRRNGDTVKILPDD